MVAALERIGIPVGEVLLSGWIEKRSRIGDGPIRSRASLQMMKARKRFALLLSCGDMIYFRNEQLEVLRGRLFLPQCTKIYCEDDKASAAVQD